MKRLIPLTIIPFTFCILLNGQNASWNMNKLGGWADASLPSSSGVYYNDIWGHTDAAGNEYAIIGSIQKVHFIDITNPGSPSEIANFAGGNNSIWRDIKTYGNYAYSAADQGSEGLMIFDMSNLPTSVTKVYQSSSFFNRAHNIFIDTTYGRLYVIGSNAPNSDIIVLDIATDPENPVLLGNPFLNGGYIHDAYVRDHIVYCSHGNAGLYVYDMTDAANPVELGNLTGYIDAGYNHSNWLSDDGNTLVFCDETHGRKVKAIDVTDLTNMSVSSSNLFFSNMENSSPLNSIAHNPIIKGNYVYISYYQDGVQVFDISDINNVSKAAYYDTYPDNSGTSGYNGYAGDWGVYVFAGSEKVIVSDDTYGLTILELAISLPIGLKSVEVSALNPSAAQIKWVTSFEENSERFEVQRSKEGETFTTIGSVPAAGNSSQDKRYAFTDNKPFFGTNYYRLRQVDFDGRAYFSKILNIEFFGKERFSVFPSTTKAGGLIRLKSDAVWDADWQLNIYDVLGHSFRRVNLNEGISEISVSTENFIAGTYLFVLSEKDRPIFTQKIVITD